MARPLRPAADAWPRATRVSGASSGAYRPTRRDKTPRPEPRLRRLILASPDTSTERVQRGARNASCATAACVLARHQLRASMKPDRLQFAALLGAATAAALSCADHGITGPTAPSIRAPVFASTTSRRGGGGGGRGGGGGGGGGTGGGGCG